MESERKGFVKELFRQVEEHKKDPEYMKALEETHKYLTHHEGKKLILAE